MTLAHAGIPIAPHDLWRAWSLEPWVLLGLGAGAWLYARGVRRLWDRAGVGRGVRPWQVHCFSAGILAVFVALISPLDALGGALFSGHMAQHMILILVAAPLLVLGTPIVPLLWAGPLAWRRRLGPLVRVHVHPAMAWGLHAVALWAWHVPSLYQATLRSELVHVAQHVSFLGTALLFWWALFHQGRRGRAAYGVGVLYVFTTAGYSSVLGALLTFAPRPWYPAYTGSTAAWGLSPLEDQQLGGLIMWIPGGIVYLVAALVLAGAWLHAMERRVENRPPTLQSAPQRG